ncbi:tigger transposable element-derived protein [Elysia marginata]|uniref:Tigger transposable element-derived protein n=1 Tax=Elysia marginata TaxID=1093978 RepID=A0AAV4FAS9_9GAST|nr:tigger transposable element-derived protein [Elysia marginata]
MAQQNQLQVPQLWHDDKEAGKEWLYHFMQRNTEFSLRIPEATSLACALAFNRPNIAVFFKLLNETVRKTKATAFSIFNLDESGCTTVQRVPKALEFARKKYIHILTLPRHTSHKTQPLDRTVFGSLKTYFNAAANALMLQHPGKNITIYNMAALINEARMKASTPHNITSGSQVSGIWPMNKFVFEENDYLPASVTDRPVSVSEQPANGQPVCEHDNEVVDQ